MYEIIFKKQPLKYISSLDKKNKIRIKQAVDKLKIDPYVFPYKKIVNFENVYRIRVGEYRIIYHLENKKLVIEIIKIGKRENVYEKLN